MPPALDEFLAACLARLGHPGVCREPALLRLVASDFSEIDTAPAVALLKPRNTGDVAAIASLATRCGIPLALRGGATSYTLASTPHLQGTVVLDMTGLNRILRIDPEDQTLIVEAGATWQAVAEALEDTGLQLRLRGPASACRATIGGALANNAAAADAGDLARDLLGVEAVLADGRIIRTGGLALDGDRPGRRYGGPDLTGLFINDAGIMGIRTRAAFRLYPRYRAVSAVAWSFAKQADLLAALGAISRTHLANKILGLDALFYNMLIGQPAPPKATQRALAKTVFAQAGSAWRGAARLAGMAWRRGPPRLPVERPFFLLAVCDGYDSAGTARAARAVAEVARGFHAQPMPADLAYGLRASPFAPLSALLQSPDGACCVPLNASVPFSRAMTLVERLDALQSGARADLAAHNVQIARAYWAIEGEFCVEPIFYWRDRLSPLRLDACSEAQRERWGSLAADPGARRLMLDLRARIVREVFEPLCASHLQQGKYYGYLDRLTSADTRAALLGIKDQFDPQGVLNAGGLHYCV